MVFPAQQPHRGIGRRRVSRGAAYDEADGHALEGDERCSSKEEALQDYHYDLLRRFEQSPPVTTSLETAYNLLLG